MKMTIIISTDNNHVLFIVIPAAKDYGRIGDASDDTRIYRSPSDSHGSDVPELLNFVKESWSKKLGEKRNVVANKSKGAVLSVVFLAVRIVSNKVDLSRTTKPSKTLSFYWTPIIN